MVCHRHYSAAVYYLPGTLAAPGWPAVVGHPGFEGSGSLVAALAAEVYDPGSDLVATVAAGYCLAGYCHLQVAAACFLWVGYSQGPVVEACYPWAGYPQAVVLYYPVAGVYPGSYLP